MAKKAVHYGSWAIGSHHVLAKCGFSVPTKRTTSDINLVTCKKCIKKIQWKYK